MLTLDLASLILSLYLSIALLASEYSLGILKLIPDSNPFPPKPPSLSTTFTIETQDVGSSL